METMTYKHCTIRIEQDEDAEGPREWDNLGTMACWHKRYNLGDTGKYGSPHDFNPNDYPICLPLYLSEHSGMTISVGRFSCPWDSGQVGWIFASKDTLLKEYGGKYLTKKLRSKATEVLRGEVTTYDLFLTGQCYGYIAEGPEGQDIDSCWGFLEEGSLRESYMVQEAKASIDSWLQEAEEARVQSETHMIGL